VHPFGKVPAITCGDGTPVFESGAILMYMADAYGGLSTPEARAAAAAWVVFANATLWPAVSGASRGAAMPPICAALEARLAQQPFLAGAAFGVADVAVGAYLFYATAFFRDVSFKPYPALSKYKAALEARPAFAATVGNE
jgi:glutathione S-transferase